MYGFLKDLAAARPVAMPVDLAPTSIVESRKGNHAKYLEEKSPLFMGCLAFLGGAGGLTRGFWVVFEENSLGWASAVTR